MPDENQSVIPQAFVALIVEPEVQAPTRVLPTHHHGAPSRTQQRLQRPLAGSRRIGNLGRFDVGAKFTWGHIRPLEATYAPD